MMAVYRIAPEVLSPRWHKPARVSAYVLAALLVVGLLGYLFFAWLGSVVGALSAGTGYALLAAGLFLLVVRPVRRAAVTVVVNVFTR